MSTNLKCHPRQLIIVMDGENGHRCMHHGSRCSIGSKILKIIWNFARLFVSLHRQT